MMRKIYLTASVFIAGVLCLAGFAGYQCNTAGRGWHLAASACCVTGAVGVIWLGWRWLKLHVEVMSIAGNLRGGQAVSGDAVKSRMLKALGDALRVYSEKKCDYEFSLEKQIKELRVQLQLAQRQKRNTEAIIYGIRDAVIVIDEFDKLLMANEAAEKLLGFDFKDSQRKSLADVIDPEKGDFTNVLRQVRLNGVRHTRRELKFFTDERIRVFDCIVSCVYDGAGQENEHADCHRERACGVVAVLHDITREKEVSQMKDDFVSHVSHELKTPLASITAYSEMLIDDEVNDDKTRKEFYSVIQSQAKRLNRLIEDILNTARIESGLIKIKKEPVSLTILIEEQLRMMKSYAAEKDITLSWAGACHKPIIFDQVVADKDMMSQVIVNLLSNAVKYTPAGGSIKVDTEVDELALVARVSVSDTGVGIPENEVEHVFDKFYRVEANKKQAAGTGLGLNLVKQIVEKIHNGRVFVTSSPGQGSTFGFELPLATAEAVKV